MFIRRILMVGLLLLFWHLAAQGGQITGVDIVPYILVASGVQFLTAGSQFPQSGVLRRAIKDGSLNNLLIRPFDPVRYGYGVHLGRHLFDILFSIINIIVGIAFIQDLELSRILLFAVSLVPAILIGYGINVMVAATAFWLTEAGHFTTIAYFIFRIASGMFVPLTLFGAFWGTILQFLPSAQSAYVPSAALTADNLDRIVLLVLLGFVQAPIMLWLSRKAWNAGIKHYGGVGI